MTSVIISAVLLRLSSIAGAAVNLAGYLPKNRPFELSDDGEYLYNSGERYDFVGFSEDGSYITDNGVTVSAGRRLGYVTGSSGCQVRSMNTGEGTYVMLQGASDCGEIYRLSE